MREGAVYVLQKLWSGDVGYGKILPEVRHAAK